MSKESKTKYVTYPIEKERFNVEAKYVICEDDIYYFYNNEDQSDKDQPIAMLNKSEISRIIKGETNE